MRTIQILGTGCPRCEKLVENARTAVRDLKGEFAVEKITDLDSILELGVMITPGLAIDGELKASGRLLSPDEIRSILAESEASREEESGA